MKKYNYYSVWIFSVLVLNLHIGSIFDCKNDSIKNI